MHKSAILLILLSAICLFSGCATIVHGTSTKINISSNPIGAKVKVNNRECITPCDMTLSNKNSYTIEISKEGYKPYIQYIDQKMSGWVWGNILFGGIIGVCVDYASGGANKLIPTKVNAELQSE